MNILEFFEEAPNKKIQIQYSNSVTEIVSLLNADDSLHLTLTVVYTTASKRFVSSIVRTS